jgi:hypothetical protein
MAGSYQKDGKGTYESIPIEGAAPGSGSSSNKKYFLIGGALLIVAAAVYGFTGGAQNAGEAQDAAMAAAALPTSKTGKLKLFDSSGESVHGIHC